MCCVSLRHTMAEGRDRNSKRARHAHQRERQRPYRAQRPPRGPLVERERERAQRENSGTRRPSRGGRDQRRLAAHNLVAVPRKDFEPQGRVAQSWARAGHCGPRICTMRGHKRDGAGGGATDGGRRRAPHRRCGQAAAAPTAVQPWPLSTPVSDTTPTVALSSPFLEAGLLCTTWPLLARLPTSIGALCVDTTGSSFRGRGRARARRGGEARWGQH